MIYRSDLNLPVIKVNNKAYQVKVKTKIDKVKDKEAIKKGLNCPVVIHDNSRNEILFCRKIEEANVVEYIEDKLINTE